MEKFNLIATCAAGIEAITANELKHLGYDVQTENGRVRFSGTMKDVFETNLWLRTADRIKIVVAEFEARTFDELFEKTKALPWDEFLPLDAEFPVSGKSQKSRLHNVPSVQSIVKKAIVDKMCTVYFRRTQLPETGALYPIECAINKDNVMLTLDTTGSSLFKRGYRTEKGGAPLKENMAAALVLISHWYPEQTFVDPVCGSGTIPIEAALIGHNIAPGLNRQFACGKWELAETGIEEKIREEARSKADMSRELDIWGYDIDGRMVEIARRNSAAAGVRSSINLKQMALKDFKTDKEYGVIVANPPYGERLSSRDEVHKLYRQMGEIYRPLETWGKYILTSDLKFEEWYGQKATKKRKLYNGSLRTDLFQYWGKRKPRA